MRVQSKVIRLTGPLLRMRLQYLLLAGVWLLVSGRLSLTSALLLAAAFAGAAVITTMATRGLWATALFCGGTQVAVPISFASKYGIFALTSAMLFALVLTRLSSKSTARFDRRSLAGPDRQVAIAIGASVFLVVAIVSATLGGISATSWPWVVGPILVVIVSLVRSDWFPELPTVRHALQAGMLLTILVDLLSLSRGLNISSGPFNSGRFVGSIGDYELAAEYYAVAILAALGGLLLDRSKGWRSLHLCTLVAGVPPLLATETRGAIVLLAVATALMILLASGGDVRIRRRAVVVGGVLISGALFLQAAFASTGVGQRISAIRLEGGFARSINRSSTWSYFTGLDSFRDAGLVGNGLSYPYDDIGTYPHSLFLWTIWSMGYLGLLAILALLAVAFWTAIRQSNRFDAETRLAFLLLALVSVDQVKIEVARNSTSTYFFWILLCMAVITIRKETSSAELNSSSTPHSSLL